VDAVLLSNVMQGADMGVVETTDGSGFPFKAFSEIGSLREVLGKDLEGGFSIQAGGFS